MMNEHYVCIVLWSAWESYELKAKKITLHKTFIFFFEKPALKKFIFF